MQRLLTVLQGIAISCAFLVAQKADGQGSLTQALNCDP